MTPTAHHSDGNLPESRYRTLDPATELTMMQAKNQSRPHRMAHSTAAALTALCIAASLAGCSNGLAGNPIGATPVTPLVRPMGKVIGGQNPVSGATIQLYTVGTSGVASSSTALLTGTVSTSDGTGTTDSNANAGNANNTLPLGDFNISGLYSCTGATPGTQVYMVASGGDPGGGGNSNLSLVAALGSCSYLLANAANIFIDINEVTTAAAAYALAPFTSSLSSIGASGSNPTGLVNAFANAQSLANTSTGAAGGANLPTGAVAPVIEMNTIADILALCVNSTGAGSTGCSALFSATGATDTFGAAVAMAKNPGASAITALATMVTGTAPFQPAMQTQPNDFTVAMTYNAGGALATPYGIAIDASGNAWVMNESGTAVTELSSTGSVVASPTASGLFGAQGIAVDRSGNVWVANTAGNSVVKFTLTAGSVTGTNSYTTGGISAPTAIALDSTGNAFIANFNGNSVTELSSTGSNQNSSPFTGSSSNITVPTGIAISKTGGVFVTSGLGYAVNLSNTGGYVGLLTDNALQGPVALAIDMNTGNTVISGAITGNAEAGAISEINTNGTASAVSPVTSGLTLPAGVATDGTSFWVANGTTSGSLAKFTYGSTAAASPAAGFGSLNAPAGVALDASGCVWTANSGSNTVSQFIGLASPVVTPLAANVGP